MIAPRNAPPFDELIAARRPRNRVVVAPIRPRGCDAGPSGLTPVRETWLRVLFAFDFVGAGGAGILLLTAPQRASEWLFAGRLTPDAGTAVLGCVWIALGALSIAGLVRPVAFSPVLLVQFVYKLIWLLLIGAPAGARGDSAPALMTVIFAVWVMAVGAALPWRALFVHEQSPRCAE